MLTAIIRVLLIIISVFGIRSYMKRLASSCCGSSGEKSPKRIRIKDRDLSRYPHQCTMKVDGVSCGNCAVRAESILNAMEGVWVGVSLEAGEAQVYMKQKYEDKALKDAVKAAGYAIFKINHTK